MGIGPILAFSGGVALAAAHIIQLSKKTRALLIASGTMIEGAL